MRLLRLLVLLLPAVQRLLRQVAAVHRQLLLLQLRWTLSVLLLRQAA